MNEIFPTIDVYEGRPKVNKKPIGIKNYGSIPHLPQSRMGPGDHKCSEGQARIATEKTRDKNDEVICQEKLDGSNVGIANVDGVLYPLGRSGYDAITSPYKQHRLFHKWVMMKRYKFFLSIIKPGERLIGEWCAQAHGTRYRFDYEPFIAFDIMVKHYRMPYAQFSDRIDGMLRIPELLFKRRGSISIEEAMKKLGSYGYHGALDQVEGCVWRVERDKPTGKKGEKKRVVDFLVKYVRPDKVDGTYLPNDERKEEIWNEYKLT